MWIGVRAARAALPWIGLSLTATAVAQPTTAALDKALMQVVRLEPKASRVCARYLLDICLPPTVLPSQ
jgi:hypothetical protein